MVPRFHSFHKYIRCLGARKPTGLNETDSNAQFGGGCGQISGNVARLYYLVTRSNTSPSVAGKVWGRCGPNLKFVDIK